MAVMLWQIGLDSMAQSGTALGFDPYLTLSGNFDFDFQKTQFYARNQDAVVGDWDTRLELWLPPFRTNFSWGPYLRFAGIDSSKGATSSWFDNAFLAEPGGGFQLYPFSLPYFRETNTTMGDIFGPLRLFGEYNCVDYWGAANTWRPTDQIRAGMDYWRARNVNDTDKPFWNEIWTGCYYQSANDFTDHYDTLVFANSARVGARVPGRGFLSMLSPYVVLESSFTGHPSYYWENRLLLGAGLRFTPPFQNMPDGMRWLNRVVLFAEYLNTATYYYGSPSASVPHYDVQAGLSFSIGEWYH
jgi:hypothetical protein